MNYVARRKRPESFGAALNHFVRICGCTAIAIADRNLLIHSVFVYFSATIGCPDTIGQIARGISAQLPSEGGVLVPVRSTANCERRRDDRAFRDSPACATVRGG